MASSPSGPRPAKRVRQVEFIEAAPKSASAKILWTRDKAGS